MNISESFLTALDSILANKLRSVLTMLGIIIGVASVIALLAIGNGIRSDITDEITAIGTNLLTISTDTDNSEGYPTLTLADAEALADPLNAPDVARVAAVLQGGQTAVFEGEALNTTVSGVTAGYLALNGFDDYQLGDGLTDDDVATSARVAVLGAGAAADLFGDAFPIGNAIKINGVGYEVVGVLADSGGGIGANTDDTIFVPLTTAQSRLYAVRTRSGEKAVSAITVEAASAEQVEAAIDQVTATLRDRHGILYAADDDFSIFDQSSLLDTVNAVTGTLTAFLGAIAGISLMVGGIGIMNIMLVSVTERTREIGIRKALGALRRDILAQFLLESLTLSLLGGALGIGLGWGITTIAGSLIDVPMLIDPATVALSASFAAVVGLLFGIYPAWRAAGLRPIEALRYE